jgi:hypothetical protein
MTYEPRHNRRGRAVSIALLLASQIGFAGAAHAQTDTPAVPMAFNIEAYDPHADVIDQSVRGLIRLSETPFKSEVIQLKIEDLGEIEHKFIMPQDASLMYSWRVLDATGAPVTGDGVFYEFHGHPSSADAPNYPEGFEMGYSKSEGTGQNGTFTAPFPGYHGWYFMNLEQGPITVELTVSGDYSAHKEMYRAVNGEVLNAVEF